MAMNNSSALLSHVSAALVNAVLLPYSLKMGINIFFFSCPAGHLSRELISVEPTAGPALDPNLLYSILTPPPTPPLLSFLMQMLTSDCKSWLLKLPSIASFSAPLVRARIEEGKGRKRVLGIQCAHPCRKTS